MPNKTETSETMYYVYVEGDWRPIDVTTITMDYPKYVEAFYEWLKDEPPMWRFVKWLKWKSNRPWEMDFLEEHEVEVAE